ncbi:MAG: sulfotransferase [Planctomycetota bacterium]
MASPFFIVGSGRCGSTWLYYVLRDHPHIAMTDEARVLEFLYHCTVLAGTPHNQKVELATRDAATMQGVVHADHVGLFAPLFTRHVKAICEDFYRERFPGKAYRYWGDKLPEPRAALSARYVWPDARYLVLVRDPRDVLCSWRAHARKPHVARDFPELQDLPVAPFARSWDVIYRGLQQELDDPLLLRYEDLCAEPRRHIQAILDYLGLAWAPELDRALDANESFANHGTSNDLAATNGRWRRDLGDSDLSELLAVCADTMRRFGYDPAESRG